MSESITTKELCERAGVKRHSLNYLAKRLGIEPARRQINERNSVVLLWPTSAVGILQRAKALRAALRRERKGKAN